MHKFSVFVFTLCNAIFVFFLSLRRAQSGLAKKGKDFISKCKQFNAEISENAAKMQTAMKLAEDDKQEIAETQAAIARIHEQIEMAQNKETATKEAIAQ